jgi:aquaporin Z
MKQTDKAEQELQDFSNPSYEWRRLCAELWGTFLLVLVASASAVMAETGELESGMAAVAAGLTVMAAIYSLGSVSGAHINPAVTLAFAVRRNFPWFRVPGYWAAQFIGGLLAASLIKFIFGEASQLGATVPAEGMDVSRIVAVETVLTAGLVSVILATAHGPRNVGPNGGIAVGGYIALAGLWAGAITGASMNPARSLAPDIMRGDCANSWMYIAGPFCGAMIGVVLEWIFKGPPSTEGNITAQGKPDGK